MAPSKILLIFVFPLLSSKLSLPCLSHFPVSSTVCNEPRALLATASQPRGVGSFRNYIWTVGRRIDGDQAVQWLLANPIVLQVLNGIDLRQCIARDLLTRDL